MRQIIFGTAICLLAVVLALAGARPAAAATTRTGETVLVRGGETVNGDLYAFGQTVRIAGIVNGDLIVAAQDVVITGTINGSINGAASTITVSGTVQNAVRAATAKLIVSGTVGGDIASASGKTTVTRGAKVGGDVLLRSGDAAFRGNVGGDIRGSASTLSIDATVGGSVLVAADKITLTRNGTIAGDLKYASNNEATVFNDQAVAGQI
ncbi:MAG TPA: polymer-forming cytoskeletal protein, partial [Thermomicrobiales bacterium]|nr:polymer-forming cytoskeletal protein [Thermomicrobiales bacterium]